MAYGNCLQGAYNILNPRKYDGDASNCIYRSSWERAAFVFCDTTPSILKWSSEEEVIPYISPLDGKQHRYFMDLKVWTRTKDGGVAITLIEIKPLAQTKPPKRGRKAEDKFLKEVARWKVNEAKWKFTEEYCRAKGWNFIIWTEDQLVNGAQADKNAAKASRKHTRDRKKLLKEAGIKQYNLGKIVKKIK